MQLIARYFHSALLKSLIRPFFYYNNHDNHVMLKPSILVGGFSGSQGDYTNVSYVDVSTSVMLYST